MPDKERPIVFTAESVRAILSGAKTQTRRVVRIGGNCQPGNGGVKFHDYDLSRAWADGCEAYGYLHVPFCLKADGWEEDPAEDTVVRVRPVWSKGDQLWVKEAWKPREVLFPDDDDEGLYADYLIDYCDQTRSAKEGDLLAWERRQLVKRGPQIGTIQNPIYMPRWASRLTLEITEVRVQRLNEISNVDAIDEGVTLLSEEWVHSQFPEYANDYREWKAVSKPPLGPSPSEKYAKLWDSINGKKRPWESNPFVWALTFRRTDDAR